MSAGADAGALLRTPLIAGRTALRCAAAAAFFGGAAILHGHLNAGGKGYHALEHRQTGFARIVVRLAGRTQVIV